ncbi:MAG: alanine racemase [Coriobacteriales bacterium]|nr:alanine racemase [Coriobacteriales bacterium]
MNDRALAEALDRFATPFYLFDESELSATIEHLQAPLPQNVSLCYAMKANPFIVSEAARRVARVEVCSPGEMRICQETGVPADQIVVSGVHKDESLMRELVQSPQPMCRFTVESKSQFDLLERLAREEGKSLALIIRLTSGNQFGVDASMLRSLARRALDSELLELKGIQYFPGTQRTSEKHLRRELKRLDAFIAKLREEFGELPADFELEFGPGLPVEYFERDEQTARAKDDAQLAVLASALREMQFCGPVILEMGRAIAALCGTYATKVVDVKRNKGQNYAIVDGGMHQLVYFGHAMSLQQPVCTLLPVREGEAETSPWNIYGSLCTTNDALAKQIPLRELQLDDVLVFHTTGAYSMTEGISLFLSRDLPRVVLRDERGVLHELRDRVETYPLNMSGHLYKDLIHRM